MWMGKSAQRGDSYHHGVEGLWRGSEGSKPMGLWDAQRKWKEEEDFTERRGDFRMPDLTDKNTIQESQLNTAGVTHFLGGSSKQCQATKCSYDQIFEKYMSFC